MFPLFFFFSFLVLFVFFLLFSLFPFHPLIDLCPRSRVSATPANCCWLTYCCQLMQTKCSLNLDSYSLCTFSAKHPVVMWHVCFYSFLLCFSSQPLTFIVSSCSYCTFPIPVPPFWPQHKTQACIHSNGTSRLIVLVSLKHPEI